MTFEAIHQARSLNLWDMTFERNDSWEKCLLREMTFERNNFWGKWLLKSFLTSKSHDAWWLVSKVMSHVWMSRASQNNESCRTYKWVTSQIWTSHVAQLQESCRTCERFMSHIWMCRITHMNESCRTYEWVKPRLEISHITLKSSQVTQMKRPCRTNQRAPHREVGGWGRDPKKCTGRGWGMGSSTI